MNAACEVAGSKGTETCSWTIQPQVAASFVSSSMSRCRPCITAAASYGPFSPLYGKLGRLKLFMPHLFLAPSPLKYRAAGSRPEPIYIAEKYLLAKVTS